MITRICEECGKEFTARKRTQRYCKGPHTSVCEVCGSSFQYTCSPKDKPHTCSKKCKYAYMQQNLSAKYGEGITNVSQVTEIKKKISESAKGEEAQAKKRKTNLERYGVEIATNSPEVNARLVASLKSEETKKKRIHTYQERYGVNHVFSDPEFREKHGCNTAGSSAEAREKSRQTMMERYGVEYPSQIHEATERAQHTRESTMTERYGQYCLFQTSEFAENMKSQYGTINAAQSDIIKERVKERNLDKYGVEYHQQLPEHRKALSELVSSEEYQKQYKETSMKRYGVPHPMNSEEIKGHMKSSIRSKYGYDYVSQNPDIKAKIQQTNLDRYGVPWFVLSPDAKNYKKTSKINKAFGEKLGSYGINYDEEFTIRNRSYDFRLTDINILLEVNPTITHNSYMSIFDKDSNGLDSNYHLNKSNLAEEHGYRCIHIFDWEDQDKILTILKINQTVYARKCYLREVDAKTTCQFEELNHIQGKCSGQKICYGMYYIGELVQVMTFGKPRYNKKYQWELLRLCTKAGYRVVGGASKMFKHFIHDYNPDSIISYCDRSKFNGEVYTRIGMNHIRDTEPNKVWSKDDKRITNNLLIQRGYDQLFNTNYGKGTSNEELMLQDGWLPVFDCGQAVYEWRKS